MNDDAVVAIATNCPYLTNLNLGGCQQLTDTSLFALAKESRNLSSVNISHTQVAWPRREINQANNQSINEVDQSIMPK